MTALESSGTSRRRATRETRLRLPPSCHEGARSGTTRSRHAPPAQPVRCGHTVSHTQMTLVATVYRLDSTATTYPSPSTTHVVRTHFDTTRQASQSASRQSGERRLDTVRRATAPLSPYITQIQPCLHRRACVVPARPRSFGHSRSTPQTPSPHPPFPVRRCSPAAQARTKRHRHPAQSSHLAALEDALDGTATSPHLVRHVDRCHVTTSRATRGSVPRHHISGDTWMTSCAHRVPNNSGGPSAWALAGVASWESRAGGTRSWHVWVAAGAHRVLALL